MQDTLLSYAHASIHNIYSLSWSFRCWLKRQCFFSAWAVLETVATTEAFLSLIYSDNLQCLAHGLISPSADYLLLWLLGNNPCTSPLLAVILEVTFYGNSTHKPVSDHFFFQITERTRVCQRADRSCIGVDCLTRLL